MAFYLLHSAPWLSHPRHLDGGAKDRVEDRDLALGVDVEIFPLEVRRGPGRLGDWENCGPQGGGRGLRSDRHSLNT